MDADPAIDREHFSLVLQDGRRHQLSPAEWRLFTALYQRHGRIVPLAELATATRNAESKLHGIIYRPPDNDRRKSGAADRAQGKQQLLRSVSQSLMFCHPTRVPLNRLIRMQRGGCRPIPNIVIRSEFARPTSRLLPRFLPGEVVGSGANSRHEQTILASLCDVQARSTAFQTAGAARP